MTILIVDDDSTNLKLLEAMLLSEKMSVLKASNGIAAMKMLEQHSVQAIISDILMPEMDGYAFCMSLRKNPQYNSIPFIFYTATYTSPNDEHFARKIGANNFLTKPSPSKKILEALTAAFTSMPHTATLPENLPEEHVLRQYSKRLIEKLESKNLELEHTAKELKTVHDQLQNLFLNLDEMFFSYDLANTTMLNVSASCEKIYGYTVEQFFENPFLWKEMIHPEDKENLTVSYLALHNGRIINGTYRIIHRSGEVRWIDLKIRADIGSSGSIRRIDGIISDITKTKLAKESLKESLENYRDLFESARDAILLLSASGIFTNLNASFETLTGWNRHEWIGRSFTDLIHGDDQHKAIENFRETIQGKPLPPTEYRMKKKQGDYIFMEVTATVQHQSDGTFRLLAIARDTTERRKLEEELRQAQKLESLGTLAGGIAHDFNNILGILLGYISLLQTGAIKPHKIANSYETMKNTINRGASIVRQLLTFARKNSASLDLIDINSQLKELAKLLGEILPKKIEIITEFTPHLPLLYADSTQLHQVFLNICVNARDAMPSGGMLIIRTEENSLNAIDHQIHISLRDTGTGMDKKTMDRIFDPFFTTKEKGVGTGLGLAVAYGVIAKHDGIIDVESELGKGTTFHIYLPIGQQKNIDSENGMLTHNDILGGHETILIIEDELEMLDILHATLSSKGYNVIPATDGLEGVQKFLEHKDAINLVISDLGLPKLNGEEVYQQVKEVREAIRFIIVSGYLDPAYQEEILASGIKQVVYKPYAAAEILTITRAILDQQ